jgi:hypothetical protein
MSMPAAMIHSEDPQSRAAGGTCLESVVGYVPPRAAMPFEEFAHTESTHRGRRGSSDFRRSVAIVGAVWAVLLSVLLILRILAH